MIAMLSDETRYEARQNGSLLDSVYNRLLPHGHERTTLEEMIGIEHNINARTEYLLNTSSYIDVVDTMIKERIPLSEIGSCIKNEFTQLRIADKLFRTGNSRYARKYIEDNDLRADYILQRNEEKYSNVIVAAEVGDREFFKRNSQLPFLSTFTVFSIPNTRLISDIMINRIDVNYNDIIISCNLEVVILYASFTNHTKAMKNCRTAITMKRLDILKFLIERFKLTDFRKLDKTALEVGDEGILDYLDTPICLRDKYGLTENRENLNRIGKMRKRGVKDNGKLSDETLSSIAHMNNDILKSVSSDYNVLSPPLLQIAASNSLKKVRLLIYKGYIDQLNAAVNNAVYHEKWDIVEYLNELKSRRLE